MELRLRRKNLGWTLVGFSGGVECSCMLGSLIVRWDVWELVGEKMVVDDLHFWALCTHFGWGLGW